MGLTLSAHMLALSYSNKQYIYNNNNNKQLDYSQDNDNNNNNNNNNNNKHLHQQQLYNTTIINEKRNLSDKSDITINSTTYITNISIADTTASDISSTDNDYDNNNNNNNILTYISSEDDSSMMNNNISTINNNNNNTIIITKQQQTIVLPIITNEKRKARKLRNIKRSLSKQNINNIINILPIDNSYKLYQYINQLLINYNNNNCCNTISLPLYTLTIKRIFIDNHYDIITFNKATLLHIILATGYSNCCTLLINNNNNNNIIDYYQQANSIVYTTVDYNKHKEYSIKYKHINCKDFMNLLQINIYNTNSNNIYKYIPIQVIQI